MLLQQIRDLVRTRIGVDEEDFDDVTVDTYINLTYWDLLARLDIEESKKTVTFPTVASNHTYELPVNLEAISHISIEDTESGTHTPIDPWDVDEYERNYVNNTDFNGIPTHYVRDSKCAIKLFPTPDAEYIIKLRHREILDDISDTNNDPRLPRQFDTALLSGTIAECHKHFKDYTSFQQEYSFYELKVNSLEKTLVKSKEKEDYSRAGLQPFIPTYP